MVVPLQLARVSDVQSRDFAGKIQAPPRPLPWYRSVLPHQTSSSSFMLPDSPLTRALRYHSSHKSKWPSVASRSFYCASSPLRLIHSMKFRRSKPRHGSDRILSSLLSMKNAFHYWFLACHRFYFRLSCCSTPTTSISVDLSSNSHGGDFWWRRRRQTDFRRRV